MHLNPGMRSDEKVSRPIEALIQCFSVFRAMNESHAIDPLVAVHAKKEATT